MTDQPELLTTTLTPDPGRPHNGLAYQGYQLKHQNGKEVTVEEIRHAFKQKFGYYPAKIYRLTNEYHAGPIQPPAAGKDQQPGGTQMVLQLSLL